jgi:hypothetical protein
VDDEDEEEDDRWLRCCTAETEAESETQTRETEGLIHCINDSTDTGIKCVIASDR